MPKSSDDPWFDMIYAHRGQIGLRTEELTLQSNVDWTKGAQGNISEFISYFFISINYDFNLK